MSRRTLAPHLLAALLATPGSVLSIGRPEQSRSDFAPSHKVKSRKPKTRTGEKERARRRRQIERGTPQATEVSDA